nr:uncharacterized protein LOC100176175 isoform X2 [Ciona intestinalis]|eukprot:XP_002124331.1 uncharacterized protein LOC100176175 isoform X2 [Ciona intestinalis]
MEQILYPADDPFRLRMYRTAERSQKPSKCSYCFRFLSNNCFMNGLFGLSHLIGYTQFMVFIIVRVIVLGSVAGRLFLHDEENLNCTVTNVTAMIQIYGDLFQENQSNDSRTLRFGADRGQLRNESIAEIKSTCIRAVYNGYMSPLCAWLVSMFPTILAWLMLIPWTPFLAGQEYVDCRKFRWPCLTMFISNFIKASIRFILESSFLIVVIVAFKMYIPNIVFCYGNEVTCRVLESAEKTCFIWLLCCASLASIFLTALEIVHMCNNKQGYDSDTHEPYYISEFANERSSISDNVFRGTTVARESSSVSVKSPLQNGTRSNGDSSADRVVRIEDTIKDEDEVFYE